MDQELDREAIMKAVRHPANYKPLLLCSTSLIIVGMMLIILGIVALIIDHIELGPPHYDAQYARYSGTEIGPIVGPMFIAFGFSLIIGNIIVIIYASVIHYKRNSSEPRRRPVIAKDQGLLLPTSLMLL